MGLVAGLHDTIEILEDFIRRGQRAQRVVDTILQETSMPRPKTPRSSRKPFGGYKISFAGQAATLEEVFGTEALAPSDMTKRLWAYVKRRQLATR
jgi:hypothetical protein